MPVRSLILWIQAASPYLRPPPLRPQEAWEEKGEPEGGRKRRVKDHWVSQRSQKEWEEERELEDEAEGLGGEALLRVGIGSSERDQDVEGFVKEEHQSVETQVAKEEDKEGVGIDVSK